MTRAVAISVLGTWVLAAAFIGWTFIVMMGQTTTQGGRVAAGAFAAVLIAAGFVLPLMLWLLWYIKAAAGVRLGWWLALLPVLIVGYLAVAMAIQMVRPVGFDAAAASDNGFDAH